MCQGNVRYHKFMIIYFATRYTMAVKFTFLILPHLHIMDLAGPDQALHESIEYHADFTIEYCGLNESITTTSGLPLGQLKHFDTVTLHAGDYLIIPGASYAYLTSVPFLQQKSLFSWLRNLYAQGVNLCSICMGAFVLAESGLLDQKICTTHFKKTKELQSRYPKLKVQENILYTYEDHIYTSAGIAAGIDLILYIIEREKDSYFAHLIARELVVYNRRNGDAQQESELLKYRNHIHSGIHRVQDYLFTHIGKKTKLTDLAELANMSERNFTRVFKKETSITVNTFITNMRLAKARELLKNPDLSRIEIAGQIGLGSERQLSRLLNKLHHK